jgi:FMN phosphatase YigB (HAD superfamily)
LTWCSSRIFDSKLAFTADPHPQTRQNGLPWDTIFAGDTFDAYKPSPKMYLGASRLLGLEPEEVCMVAAHIEDLRCAKQHGLRTVYVRRETEDDQDVRDTVKAAAHGGEVDGVVSSFEELASLF